MALELEDIHKVAPSRDNYVHIKGVGFVHPKLVTTAPRADAYQGIKLPSLDTGAQRVEKLISDAHELAPKAFQRGLLWYPQAHTMATDLGSALRWLSPQQRTKAGAGVIGALSPNANFESEQIPSIEGLKRVAAHHMDDFEELLERAKNHKGQRTISPELGRFRKAFLPGVSANASAMHKALQIMKGHDWEEEGLLGPKTEAFSHNIWQPFDSTRVTNDGRHLDSLADAMRAWGFDRGAQGGKGTSYGLAEEMTRKGVKNVAGDIDFSQFHTLDPRNYKPEVRGSGLIAMHAGLWTPSMGQAVTWEYDKLLERRGQRFSLKTPGTEAKGDIRMGQRYSQRSDAYREAGGEGEVFTDRPSTFGAGRTRAANFFEGTKPRVVESRLETARELLAKAGSRHPLILPE